MMFKSFNFANIFGITELAAVLFSSPVALSGTLISARSVLAKRRFEQRSALLVAALMVARLLVHSAAQMQTFISFQARPKEKYSIPTKNDISREQ